MRNGAMLCLAIAAWAVAARAESPFAVRMVHLDVARQMETVDFICDYIDFAANSGYNTVKLYFEGRLRLPTTQALPDEECYSAEDVRRICAKAKSRGVEIVPAIEALGHNEHFFRDGKRLELSEERDGAGRWKSAPSTFCATLPAAKEFLARYMTEVAALFPDSRLVAVGLDETWHMGFCSLCAERRKTEGFGGIFARHVQFVHDVLARVGKRMYLSDDFYEFFPEQLANCPKDAVISHWIYDKYVSRWGHRGHFAQRIRRDLLRDYKALGLEALPAASLWYDYDNVRNLTEYAEAAGCAGMVMTQWEMTDRGHGHFAPVVAGIGAYWNDPDRFVAADFDREGLSRVFPKLTEAEKDAIVPALHVRYFTPQRSVAETLNLQPRTDLVPVYDAAIAAFGRSAYAPRGEVAARAMSPEALADDFVCQLRMARAREKLRLVGPALSSPRRTPPRVRQARRDLAGVKAELEAVAERRRVQQDVWRRNCFPRCFDQPAMDGLKVVDELFALGETAAEDEWWCEAALSMPEYHMHPYWSIYLKVDGKWVQIASEGYWKAGMRDWANFEKIFPFRLNGTPTDLRIAYHGRGPSSMTYLSVESRDKRLGPKALTKTEGLVRDPENLLVDNWKSTSFGWPDTMETFHNPALQDVVSAAEFELTDLTVLK